MAGGPRPAAAVLRVAAGYFAADAAGSALKRVVGRARPAVGDGPWRFRPMSGEERWHGFPSGHVVHVAALAAGLAVEADRPWVTAVGTTAAALVGAQRVYRGAHWPSDVVAGALVGAGAGAATVRWLRRRPFVPGAAHPAPRPSLLVVPAPGGVEAGVVLAF
jgi:undecaprenyl-diphosphatase